MTASNEGRRVDPEDLEQTILHQDSYRKVLLGEVSDPLFPPHPGAPESSEEDLTRAALDDPAAATLNVPHPQPTFWRLVTVLLFAVGALGVVFWWFR